MNSKESYGYAESILDTVREPLIVLDEDLRVVSTSRSFYRQFRTTREQTERRVIYELDNGQWDIPELRHLLEALIPERTTIDDFELRLRSETVGEKLLLLNARRIVGEDGKTNLILLAFEDITKGSAACGRLAESEEKYRGLVEEINSIIIRIDRNAAVTFFNRFSEELFGYNRGEVLGKPFIGTIIPSVDSEGKDNTRIREEIFVDTPKYYANESEGMRRDGSRIWFSWSARAVRDDAGNVEEILIDGNDISELVNARKKTERTLADALHDRTLLRQIIEEVPVGIALHEGPDFITTMVNSEYSRFAYGKGDILNRPVAEVWSEIADRIVPLLRHVCETGEPYQATDAEFTLERGNGSEKAWFSFSYLPFRGRDNRITGVLVWSFETTEYVLARQAEARARVQAERRSAELDAVINSIPDGHIVYGPDRRILRMNAVAEEVLGYSDEERNLPYEKRLGLLQVRTPDGEPFPIEDIPFNRAFGGEIVRNVIMKIDRPKRSYWLSVSAAPIAGNGGVPGVVMEFADITDLKTTEAALRESEERLRFTLEATNIGTWDLDLGDKTAYHSPEHDRIFGYEQPLDRWTQADFVRHVLPEYRESVVKLLEEATAAGTGWTYDCQIRRADGEIRWIWINGRHRTDWRGRERVFGVVMDITERKRVEEELRRAHGLLQSVTQGTRDMIAAEDPDFRYTFFNEAYSNEFRKLWNEDLKVGTSMLEAMAPWPQEQRKARELWGRALNGETFNITMEFGPTEQEKEYYDLRFNPLYNARGRVIGAAHFLRNVTEQMRTRKGLERRTEELAAANHELESFSYSVSHDLRNPLRAIGSFTDILMQDYADSLDEEARDYLRRIDGGVDKMQQIIDDMLSLSRVGRQEMNQKDVDLGAIACDYLNELQSMEPQRRVECIVSDDLHAYGDPQLIRVALENLLGNAWKFTSKEEVARVEFAKTEIDGATAFYIRDNGAGFDMRFADKLFEPFKRLHTDKDFGGTGVGLSIVQRVFNRHGENVWAESEPGQGATFYFKLADHAGEL